MGSGGGRRLAVELSVPSGTGSLRTVVGPFTIHNIPCDTASEIALSTSDESQPGIVDSVVVSLHRHSYGVSCPRSSCARPEQRSHLPTRAPAAPGDFRSAGGTSLSIAASSRNTSRARVTQDMFIHLGSPEGLRWSGPDVSAGPPMYRPVSPARRCPVSPYCAAS